VHTALDAFLELWFVVGIGLFVVLCVRETWPRRRPRLRSFRFEVSVELRSGERMSRVLASSGATLTDAWTRLLESFPPDPEGIVRVRSSTPLDWRLGSGA
jgi:hypothetical protein